jgi:hypothetical protein
MRNAVHVILQVCALTFLLLTACTVRAQVAGSGAIQGIIQDPTGAIVPNAAVTATNEATQVQHATETDSSGVYAFPRLDIGTYTVGVSAKGFQSYKQSGIVLEVGSNIAVNVTLTVGATSQNIEVHAEGMALQTEDSSFKQTIDQTDITEMPLNGRQMTALVTASGGSSTAPGNDFTGSKYSYATIAVSIAGGMGNTTEWKLDGGNNNDYMANGNLPFPFPDAVSQFSVESTDLGASTGAHTGGLVNVVTRSGSNQFHGTGFEFIRNNFFDATNFFSVSKDQLHQNEYGGTIGGPILKNKLFFFAGFQREVSKQNQANTNAYVPTAADLAGNWSVTDPPVGSATTICGKAQQLFDPLTGLALPGNQYNQPGGPALPTFNSAALKLLPFLPPIVPLADGSDVCGHVVYAIPLDVFDKQFITRIDYTINSKNTLYGHYLLDGYQSPAQFSPTNILLTTQNGNVERVQSGTIGEDYVISPNIVNSAHLTLLRRRNDRGYSPSDINATTLGVTAYQLEAHGLQLADATSGKNHNFTLGGGTNSIAAFNDNTLSVSDNVNWIHGKHQFVFGGELIHNQLNINNAFEGNGVFTFNGQYSGSGPAGGSVVGDANLDFLEGAMSSYVQSKAQQNALRGNIPNVYFQDTYHVSTRLTVVAGIRWVPELLPADYFHRGVEFSPTGFLANTISTVYPNAPPGISYFGDPGVSKQFTSNSPDQWSPNVGFSYDPFGGGKTVFRAGFEFAYDNANYFTSQRNQQNPPYATASSPPTSAMLCFSSPWLIGGTGFGCNQTGGNTNDNTYPSPQVPTKATAVFPAQSQFEFMPPNFRPSDTSMWTASIQHEFGHGWQMQIDYIGNRSSHDPIGIPPNPAVFIPGEWGAGGTGCAGIVTTGPAAVKPGAAGTNCSTTGNENSRFAFTIANPVGNGVNGGGNQFQGGGAGSLMIDDTAWSDYNGMVLSLNHRLSSTFSLLANYTWSKCLDVVDAEGDTTNTLENPNNLRLDYGPCGSDFRNVENVSMIAKSDFKSLNHVERAILNNWQFAPLIHINSGAPLNVVAGTDISLTDVGEDRPDLIPGVPIYVHHPIRNVAGSEANEGYLNPAAFETVPTAAGCTTLTGCSANGTYGTIGRNEFRGLANYQFDAEVSRYFPLHESVQLYFRLEAFNVFNHPDFSNPSGTFSSNGLTAGSSFGLITAQANQARVFQGCMKIIF